MEIEDEMKTVLDYLEQDIKKKQIGDRLLLQRIKNAQEFLEKSKLEKY